MVLSMAACGTPPASSSSTGDPGSGSVPGSSAAPNPAASGTYLHDEPYSFTEYVKSMSLYNQLVRYGTEED